MSTLNPSIESKIERCKTQLMGGFDNEITIWNAIIKSTFLGIEDHGIFSFMLTLEERSQGQGFGGYELKYEKYGIPLLETILKIVGVTSWEELTGKYVRVISSHCKVYGLIHITDDTRYFFIDEINGKL